VRLEMRRMVGLAIVVGVLGAGAVCGETKAPPPDKCPNGPDGAVTVTLRMSSGACVVVKPVADVCVDRGHSIHWAFVNQDCTTLDPAQDAITVSQPKPKQGQNPFQYSRCTPPPKGWPPSPKPEHLTCVIPGNVDLGHYEYGITGQIKGDPDIEVRKGG